MDEIAAHLGVNPDTIYKLISRKPMPAHRVGKLWKFPASEVDEWGNGGRADENFVPTFRGRVLTDVPPLNGD